MTDAAARFHQAPYRVEAGIDVERRAVQLEETSSTAADFVVEGGDQPRLADAGVAADQDAGCAVVAAGGDQRPGLPKPHELVLALDERRCGSGDRDSSLAHHAEGHQGLGNSLHQLRFTGLEIEAVLDELPHLVRDRDRARVGDRLQPRADVRRKAVDVVLVEVEVDGAVMDPDAKLQRFARGRARAWQLAHRLHEREPRADRPLGIVLVCCREPEDRERAVSFDSEDVAIEARLDDVAACVPIAPQQLTIGLRLEATRELGRADDVAVHECEPAKLADPRSELVAADPGFVTHLSVTPQ